MRRPALGRPGRSRPLGPGGGAAPAHGEFGWILRELTAGPGADQRVATVGAACVALVPVTVVHVAWRTRVTLGRVVRVRDQIYKCVNEVNR
jgi:hypothetical protein